MPLQCKVSVVEPFNIFSPNKLMAASSIIPTCFPFIPFPVFSRKTASYRCVSAEKAAVASGPEFSVTPRNKSDVDYLGESTKGDFNVNFDHFEAFGKATLYIF